MLEGPPYTRNNHGRIDPLTGSEHMTESEGIEMSDDQPENVAQVAPVLRREALLPNERSRGLGTVAVVCTMAGVASGLALATTLMAMQVADSMSSRGCPYRNTQAITQGDVRSDHGFLGIRYVFRNGVADIDSIVPGTPAEAINLKPGDHVIAVNNVRLRYSAELQERIFNSRPGSTPSLVVERHGEVMTVHPTLIAWPAVTY
jgi:S1-C subfamily serine protease